MDKNTIAALRKMEKYGGSFASLIAQAWFKADLSNQRKFQREFGDLLNQYRPRAEIASPDEQV